MNQMNPVSGDDDNTLGTLEMDAVVLARLRDHTLCSNHFDFYPHADSLTLINSGAVGDGGRVNNAQPSHAVVSKVTVPIASCIRAAHDVSGSQGLFLHPMMQKPCWK